MKQNGIQQAIPLLVVANFALERFPFTCQLNLYESSVHVQFISGHLSIEDHRLQKPESCISSVVQKLASKDH